MTTPPPVASPLEAINAVATVVPPPARKRQTIVALGAVGGFFALKILVGMALVVQSARALSVAEFGVFSQLFLFLALLGTVAAGGVQNGLIRQVAAAGQDLHRERRAVAAAILIWLGFGAIVLASAIAGAGILSNILVGGDRATTAVPIIAAAALGSGGGQLLCAILTGRGRAGTSLLLQSVGLMVGGCLCWLRLGTGDAMGAVTGYAVGQIITFVLALPVAWRWMPNRLNAFRGVEADLRLLLGFSGAFLMTAVIMPTTLFALRYVYRLSFGEIALGYWLAANRVSDVTSQLLGLYMGQIYLPAATRAAGRLPITKLAKRTLLAGVIVMSSGLIVFVMLAPWLVRTFLSAPFLPAIPFITFYLIGDVLRVATSLSLHTALARGRLALYVGTEAATAACIALYMLALTAMGRAESAYWGYAAAQGTMAALAGLGWRKGLWTRGQGSVEG